ncbi:MAG: TusE/DsrC/DsvC family sulfur relay protein [Gammaproteobacteria bacterium]|nr:TusE/DsrC/DsvC family sulfur relay protein [Gammaproteobacteria bacterium]
MLRESSVHNEMLLDVNGKQIRTDKEGYIINIDEWTEDYAIALAEVEGLELTDEHWQVIHYIRDYFEDHRVQVQVREMIKHFKKAWGPERGNNHYLHDIFPKGGPQKQGNRFAGIHRTRGEH